MDELTIGEKVYISSKRAAKITGYAKDYVGQLCREGRVEARLVGRNWYVLESSITEHRFGVAEEEARVVVDSGPTEPVSWSKPTYSQEEVLEIPKLIEKSPDVVSSRRVVSEMQSAWQEWFSSQAPAPETLIEDGDDVFDGSTVPALQSESSSEQEVHISKIEAAPVPYEVPSSLYVEERVSAKNEYSHEQVTGPMLEVMDLSNRLVAAAELVVESPVIKEKSGSSLVIKSLLLGVAFVAACVALVGTGTIEELAGTTPATDSIQGKVMQYLGGETMYGNSK